MDWRSVHRARLAELWPTSAAPPEDLLEEPGSAGEFKERCCNACRTCAAQWVIEGAEESVVRIRSLGILLCRETPESATLDLQRVVDSVLPESVEASYRFRRPSGLGSLPYRSTARWTFTGQTSFVDSYVSRWGEHWTSFLELTRCEEAPPDEIWTLADGSTVKITPVSISENDSL